MNQAPLWVPFWTASYFGRILLAWSIFQKQQFSPSIRKLKPLILKPEYSSKSIEKEAGSLEATKRATVLNAYGQLDMIEINRTAIRSCYRAKPSPISCLLTVALGPPLSDQVLAPH